MSENRWLKSKYKSLDHLEKSKKDLAVQASKTMENLEVIKFKSLSSSLERECKALKEEGETLRREIKELRERREKDVEILSTRLTDKDELHRQSLKDMADIKFTNKRLAEKSFELKMRLESVEIGVRRFLVRKVLDNDIDSVPAQISIKKFPSTGEVIFSVISEDLEYEYQQDLSTLQVRSVTVDMKQLALMHGESPTRSPLSRCLWPQALGDQNPSNPDNPTSKRKSLDVPLRTSSSGSSDVTPQSTVTTISSNSRSSSNHLYPASSGDSLHIFSNPNNPNNPNNPRGGERGSINGIGNGGSVNHTSSSSVSSTHASSIRAGKGSPNVARKPRIIGINIYYIIPYYTCIYISKAIEKEIEIDLYLYLSLSLSLCLCICN